MDSRHQEVGAVGSNPRLAIPGPGKGRWRRSAAVCGGGLALWMSLVGDAPRPAAAADIRTTPHNLARNRSIVEAEEVCVFCHTPQLPANLEGRSGVAMQPAWQPSLSKNHDFLMFDDIGRKQFGKMAVGTQSIACLSCHDSNQAFQVTGGMNDHPFGVPYRGYLKRQGRVRSGDDVPIEGNGPSRAAKFLKFVDDFKLPSKGMVDKRTVWWVSSTGINAVRGRSDLPLYARPVNEDGEESETPYIECSSCHDPHVARPLFLRVSNEGSKLCLTCHDK